MTFIQIIDIETDRAGEVEAVMDTWRDATEGRRTATTSILTRDRDRDGHYLTIVEFPDYEAAMSNSDLPETQQFAEQLRALCRTEPTFVNLDEIRRDKA